MHGNKIHSLRFPTRDRKGRYTPGISCTCIYHIHPSFLVARCSSARDGGEQLTANAQVKRVRWSGLTCSLPCFRKQASYGILCIYGGGRFGVDRSIGTAPGTGTNFLSHRTVVPRRYLYSGFRSCPVRDCLSREFSQSLAFAVR